jgi:Cu/Ag efflux pump CusA
VEERIPLAARHGARGQFSASDPRLQRSPGRAAWADVGRKVTVSLNGRARDALFGTTLQRQMELRTTADWIVRPRLLKVPGLAQVTVMGGGRKQYQVQVDPAALEGYDVTLQQVEEALRKNNGNASGGFAVRGGTERPIRILGRLGPDTDQVLSQLRQVPVRPAPGRTVQLSKSSAGTPASTAIRPSC